jgi:hypothetical protein
MAGHSALASRGDLIEVKGVPGDIRSRGQVIRMTIKRSGIAALTAVLISAFSSGTLYAGTFGVFGFPIDISANVKETLLPSGTVLFQDSLPLFDTVEGESANVLDISSTGVNASGRSTNISGAFASSLSAADGSGGVGVSQLIFGSPGGSGPDAARQLFAQSLWTQTFTYTGEFPIDLTLHVHIPTLQVGLLGVPPRRSGLSATETAQASAKLVASVTHPDLTISGSSFEFGMREFERQFPSGSDLLNLVDTEFLGQTGSLGKAPKFNGDDFNPTFTFDPVSLDLNLPELHKGDTLSYVYTLTAEGTTHGFEQGSFAFLGDPFGGEVISDNLSVTVTPVTPVTPADAPEASTCLLMLSGLAGVFAWRRRTQ